MHSRVDLTSSWQLALDHHDQVAHAAMQSGQRLTRWTVSCLVRCSSSAASAPFPILRSVQEVREWRRQAAEGSKTVRIH